VPGSRPKRILFFSHYFPPEGNAPASRVHALCKRWVRKGWEVTVVTCNPNVPSGRLYDGYRNRLTQTEYVDGIRVVRVWTLITANEGVTLRSVSFLSYMLIATLRALFLARPDVIVATSPQFFCGWAGVLTKWLRRRPLVLEIRDIWPESIKAVQAINRHLLFSWLEWLELQMYRAADMIVTVGTGYRNQLLVRNVPARKLHVVTNGVDKDLFEPIESNPEQKKRLGLEGQFVCSYVGTIGMACGLDVVIRAGELLREQGRNEVTFLLVGDGAVRADLEADARARGLSNVIFLGRQPKSEIAGLIALSDCCLVHLRAAPLFQTVLPSKIFEAFAMKRPLIVGVAGHAARIAERSGGGICIEPENEQQLVAAVETLRADPARARALAESGHDYVCEHYDRDRLADHYLMLLESLCGAERAPGLPVAPVGGHPG
jgi:glycosyltransferase involved in cell wall biosynthesis